MTDKCWFVLRHSHFSPPIVPVDGVGKAEGPLCIGHVIPSTNLLDIINPTGPEEYPTNMRIYEGSVYDLKWKVNNNSGVSLSGDVSVPIAAVIGLTVESKAGIAFKKWVNRFWEFKQIDTYHVNITQSYLDDTIDSPEVQNYIAKNKALGIITPTMFMITGIMVARTAKIRETESSKKGVTGGGELDIPEFVTVASDLDISAKRKLSFSHSASDFMFAIRVAKVSKGIFDGEWSYSTLTKGSTFSAGDNLKERVKSIRVNLATVGIKEADSIGIEDGEDMFVCSDDVNSSS